MSKKVEPKAAALVVKEALHLLEQEVLSKQQAANQAAADAKAAAQQLADIRAEVAGGTSS